MNILGIIPARFASSRFPGKPLVMINGKSMIERVYQQASKSNSLFKVIVATDDKRIFDHVASFGGNVMMTSIQHRSGTERCNETLQQAINAGSMIDAVVNIQGDEPFIDPGQIELLTSVFDNKQVEIATLAKLITDSVEIDDPNVVKVTFDKNQNALYFSRSPIPSVRGLLKSDWLKQSDFFKHIGIYAYRADILAKIVRLKPTPLETAESLEQLRWLENGYQVRVEITQLDSTSVDTPEDLLKFTNIA